MNSYYCKTCNHLEIEHRKVQWPEQMFLSETLHEKILCWVTLGDGSFCDCLKFEYKNLDYLEMKYEEKNY